MFWLLWLVGVVCLQALTIQTIQDLPLKQKSGHFSGYVFYKNAAHQQLVVQGHYQLRGNQLSLQALELQKLPPKPKKGVPTKDKSTTTPLRDLKATQDLGAILPAKINKGAHIYFKDPDPKKMAQMLGLSYQDYLRFSPQERTTFLNPTAPQSTRLQPREEREENPQDRESKTHSRGRTYTPKTYSTNTRSKRTSSTRTGSIRSTGTRRSFRSDASLRARNTSARSSRSTTPSPTDTNATRERSTRSSTSSRRTTSTTRGIRTTRRASARSVSASTRSTRGHISTQKESQNQNFNQYYNQAQNTQPQHYNPSPNQSYNPPNQSYTSGTSAPTYNPSPTYSPSYMPLPLNYPQTSTTTPSTPSRQTPNTPTTPQATQPTPSTLTEIPKEPSKPLEKEPPKKPETPEALEKPKEPIEPQDTKKESQEKPKIESKKLEPNPKAMLEVQTHLGMGGAQEEACGVWSYDDAKLQAKRPSVMRALDKASGQLLDISPCDFRADSASGKGEGITLNYVELPPEVEVLGPTTSMHTFILSKANYSEKLCYKAKTRQCLHIEPNTATEWTSTYSTTTTRTTRTYQRPPQVGQTTPTEYSTTTDEVKAQRKTDIKKNDLHLSPKFLEFVEVYEKKYLDSQVAHSKEYLAWQDKYVRPKQGTCQEYQVEELIKNKKVRPSIHNTRIICVKSGDYLLEEDK
ncbi:hypothetical protein NHP190003_06350 [Helicobacter sp. NHP19-003]|uniref:Uncharacterized protein n=1 Tax=Helicobacter gastrocanis TaxID=2849641 RepID=A0ABN6I589_9HELI|nr:hypothetical protein [Helicobacter sp. NHP19-003]BCZ17353.1 hypothetical protein NHP190003_06350 [Helicobacter sp. NHP19-003]